MRVIDTDGQQLGILPVSKALEVAAERDLDLVEVSPNAAPPVCKILDFGKFKYELNKKHSQRRTMDVKEIKVRPQISDHDLELKIRKINDFIKEGNKAKVIMFFRGREIVRPELGMLVFDKITEHLEGKFQIEHQPKLEGKNITMVIAPRS